MEKEHVERLRQAGAMSRSSIYPPGQSLEEVNYRTHRKILVVDGEIGFTGGVGVADHWLGNATRRNTGATRRSASAGRSCG